MSQLLQPAGPILFVANGTTAPDHFVGGLGFEANLALCVEVDGVVDHYHQGLPFTALGRLSVALAPAVRFSSGGAPFSATGLLAVEPDDTIPPPVAATYIAGVPFTFDSLVRMSYSGTPPPPTGPTWTDKTDSDPAESNSQWILQPGQAAVSGASILNGTMLIGPTSPDSLMYLDAGIQPTDVELSVLVLNHSAQSFFGVIRAESPGTWVGMRGAGGNLEVFQRINGSFTLIHRESLAPLAGTTVKLKAVGNEVFFNDVLVGTTTRLLGGYVGMGLRAGANPPEVFTEFSFVSLDP